MPNIVGQNERSFYLVLHCKHTGEILTSINNRCISYKCSSKQQLFLNVREWYTSGSGTIYFNILEQETYFELIIAHMLILEFNFVLFFVVVSGSIASRHTQCY